LEDAFVFKKQIDRMSYVPLRDKLREELVSAELARQDATLDDLDLEAAIATSDHVLRHSAVLWRNGDLDQRRRLQSALFPVGISHDGEEFGTAVTCIAFSELRKDGESMDGMASPRGVLPFTMRGVVTPTAA